MTQSYPGIPAGMLDEDLEEHMSKKGPFDAAIRAMRIWITCDGIDPDTETPSASVYEMLAAIRALEAAGRGNIIKPPDFPKIVCFCGSSRFIEHFGIFMWEYEKDGKIALGLHWLPPSYRNACGNSAEESHQAEAEGLSAKFDELHKRKIDLASEVFILNVGGYVGESTRSEIRYAIKHGKPIRWLEPESADAILQSIQSLPDPEGEKK